MKRTLNPAGFRVISRLVFLLIVLGLPLAGWSQTVSFRASGAMVDATNAFLQSLEPAQLEKALYDFNDAERLNWHFIPRDRNGLPYKEMGEPQRQAAVQLLQAFLSTEGFEKIENIRGLEDVLAAIEVNGRFVRDRDLYYFTVFGTPSVDGSWAFRYEGHHTALNWTFVEGMGIASTPQFFGANPAEVRGGDKIGQRVLQVEEDLGRTLIQSMSSQQLLTALIPGDAPSDILTAAQVEAVSLGDEGIRYTDLESQQQAMLWYVIDEVAAAQSTALADARLNAIRNAGLEEIRFGWMGTMEKGGPHYYRVQGPTFLIEYDNTQNNANHIHLVWRDFNGDFGRDLIRLHYDAVAQAYGPGHQH